MEAAEPAPELTTLADLPFHVLGRHPKPLLIGQVRDGTTLVCHANYDVMRGLVAFLVAECCTGNVEDRDAKTAA